MIWFAACVASCIIACAIGTTSVGFASAELLWQIRLPRVLLGCFAGMGLSAAGVVFQALLRNPLADPYVVGVSGGAALGGVAAIALGITSAWSVPLWAFCGAVASTALLFGIAHARQRSDALTLLLVGVIFNAFAAAVVTFIKTIVSPTKAQEILFWLMGCIATEPFITVVTLGIYVALGCIVLQIGSGALNVLGTGDDQALALGLPVARVRMLLFLAAALVVAAVVSTVGMIAFVGLVIPHLVRRFVGADHRRLLPAACFAGGAFLVLADAGARLSFLAFHTELPVGVLTAFLGGPFFLTMLLSQNGKP